MKTTLLLFLFTSFIALQQSYGQTFTEIVLEEPGFSYGSLEWGDYDNDSDMDFIATGFVTDLGRRSIIYKNNGDGSFSSLPDSLIAGTNFGGTKWVDYDNDGDLDLFVNGRVDDQVEYISRIYRNDGNDQFSAAWDFIALDNASFDWGDYNNDGFADFILSGSEHPDFATWIPKTYLYENDQNGGFFIADSSFHSVSFGSCTFADYDNDNDLDLLITGLGDGVRTDIYRNDNGAFIDIQAGLIGLTTSSSVWADFDNDGDFDCFIGGSEGSISLTKALMYSNEGNDTFTEVSISGDPIPQVTKPSFDVADFDNDGDMDVLLTGQIGLSAERITAIYRNEGNFSFTLLDTIFTSVREGDANWADYDNDGDLDVLLCGDKSGSTKTLKLYRNESTVANFTPIAPENLISEVIDHSVNLSWEAGFDEETPGQSLTYNIRIGSAPGLSDVFSAMSSTDGFRTLVKSGNANMNHEWTIHGLEDGQYFWSVQTIDGSYTGSFFSEESSFEVGSITNSFEFQQVDANKLHIFPNPVSSVATISYRVDQSDLISGSNNVGKLSLFTLHGKLIRQVDLGLQTAGEYHVRLDMSDLSEGIYLCRLELGEQSRTMKLIVN